jgi:hypothetical protein
MSSLFPTTHTNLTAILPVFLPLLSPKSHNKLHPTPSLHALHTTHGLSLKGIDLHLGDLIQEERATAHPHPNPQYPQYAETPKNEGYGASYAHDTTWGGTITSALGTAGSYLSLPRFGLGEEAEVLGVGAEKSTGGEVEGRPSEQGYWGRNARDVLVKGKVPVLFDELRKVILKSYKTEGLFRRSSNVSQQGPMLGQSTNLSYAIQDRPGIPDALHDTLYI